MSNLSFYSANIGDKGAKALGAALQVWRAPLALIDISLVGNQLTVAGLAPVIAALRRGFAGEGLRSLDVGDNPKLGDAGVTLLAGALPPELRRLGISNTGCRDEGMEAVAAAAALAHLTSLFCSGNPAVGQVGWAALGAALPQMSSLTCLEIRDAQMDDAGAAALAAGLPGAPVLQELYLSQSHVESDSLPVVPRRLIVEGATVSEPELPGTPVLPEGIGDAGAVALAAVLPRCLALQSLELTNHSYGIAGLEALNAAAAEHGSVHIDHPVDLESSDEDW